MDPQEKEQIAQEKYGKPFAELTTNEQRGVGGVHGGHIGGTVNKTPEERAQGVIHHEPMSKEDQKHSERTSGSEQQTSS